MAKILIVDDDIVSSQIYANKLISEKHEVTLCSNGQEALDKIADKYDLILLDIMMPQVNGIELLKELKNGPNKDSVTLVYTNLTNEDTKKECLDNGAKEFLFKADYNPFELLDKIKQYLPHEKV